MKAVLMAFSPKECEKILSGEKTAAVRKVAPKLETPFKVYVYMTATKERCRLWEYITAYQNSKGVIVNGSQKVVGEFVCYEKECFAVGSLRCDAIEDLACLSYQEMIEYFYKPEELDGETVKAGTALHITEPKRYDTPKELSEFVSCKYYKDEECLLSNKTHCKYRVLDLNPDGSVNIFECRKRVTRAPQSWMYVEEREE